jgi:nucleoporin NUP82
VHIAVLPEEYEVDIGPLRPKSFQLGPTEHIPEASAAVVCGLWHPLGVHGRCFITITEDSVIRLWELNRDDRSSFEASALSIDLRKLANAKDAQDNLRASVYGAGKAFSPDTAYLEPIAACFGGLGRNGESPYSSMTLWVAMTDGDLYALCPLLPARFQSYTGMVSSLSNTLNAKSKEIMEASGSTPSEEDQLRQQTVWIQDLESQEPYVSSASIYGSQTEVLSRPKIPRPEPKLQGPFDFGLDDIEIADIFIRNVSVGEEPLEFETGEILIDESDDLDPMGLSVLCLVDSSSQLHIILDTEGVEPRWLPSKTPQSTPKKNALVLASSDEEPIPLLLLGSLRLSPSASYPPVLPLITPDVRSPYAFFITHAAGVSYVSLDALIERLQSELIEPPGAGSDFRLDLFLNNSKPTIEHLIKFDKDQNKSAAKILACIALLDEDLGYFVLASMGGHPYAVSLDTRYTDFMRASTRSETPYQTESRESASVQLPAITRQPYEADDRFYTQSGVPGFLKSLSSRSTVSLHENVHLSAETLSLLIEAHQVFSTDCQRLSEAVARAYRACHRMVNEFNDQIEKVRDIARRVDSITGNDEENYGDDEDFDEERGRERIEGRLKRASERQQELVTKYRGLQKKLGALSGRKLSDREKSFAREIEELSTEFNDASKKGEAGEVGRLYRRYDDVKTLCDDISAHSVTVSQEISKSKEREDGTSSPNKPPSERPSSRQHVPAGFRKAKMDRVVKLLERETAMVESTAERLARLSLGFQGTA